MLRSLFAGVTGLQAHQVAMDVESNNIANVNTIGYKYSRANFSDLLAQTNQIATAPQGALGGKNAVQVGLGSSIGSITKIMTQGSIQNTDKNTDVAIQGDGFFIVSADGGNTYKYSRSGDFKFDAGGNFVDNGGNIVQGWLRDPDTNKVDSSSPIKNIKIAPGLTTPANATTDVVLKANLDSGQTVETFSVTNPMKSYSLTDYQSYTAWQAITPAPAVGSGAPAPATPAIQALWTAAYDTRTANTIAAEDMNVMFNDQGQSLTMQPSQGIWVSYKDATATRSIPDPTALPLGSGYTGAFSFTINGTAISGTAPDVDRDGNAAYIAQQINAKTSVTGVVAIATGGGTGGLQLVNDNSRESDAAVTKNILITGTLGGVVNNTGDTSNITAYQYAYATNPVDISSPTAANASFRTTEQLRLIMETHAKDVVGGAVSVQSTTLTAVGGLTYPVTATVNGVVLASSASQAALAADIQAALGAGAVATVNGANIDITGLPNGTPFTLTATDNAAVAATVTPVVAGTTGFADGIKVTINSRGQFEVVNDLDGDNIEENLKLQITAFKDSANNVSKNQKLTDVMQSLNGTLVEGSTGIRISQGLDAATHSTSIDIFDSLGSKHTMRMDFRKVNVDAATGATWSMKLSVPEPGAISTVAPYNEIDGQVRFTADGALSSYSPTNVNFTAGNGSTPNQNVNIKLGTSNAFDGMTSFDATSGTSGISQDGFPGGDLVGIRIDQSGTLIGSFSNGRSFGLAQIGMAKFTNNEGLMTDGGNVYLQSANSGDPIIGVAATAGRGFMQSSALEASNVDLSKSLTNLIIIQRGYQANGKTITTSDTLLETLLGIKR